MNMYGCTLFIIKLNYDFISLLNSIYDNLEKLELTLSFHSVIKAFLKRIWDLGAH